MRSLVSRLKWLAVPLLAYLAITLGLPLANGARIPARHAGMVFMGCLFVVAIAVIGGALYELGHRLANKRNARNVGERS